MIFTIDPHGWEVVEWIERMTPALEPFGNVPRIEKPEEWQEWARYVIQNTRIAKCQPPDPAAFEDWQEWACRFNQAIYGLKNQ